MRSQKGFSLVEGLLAVIALGIIGFGGYYVWNQNQDDEPEQTNSAQENEPTTNATDEPENEPVNQEPIDYETLNGINYTVPADWRNTSLPTEPYGSAGSYLLSPDYEEAGLGQLSILSGGYIIFNDLEWAGIDSNTSIEKAVSILKNSEGYYDADSVKTSEIGGTQVILFNGGHTTDGVNAFFKNKDSKWLEAGFTTASGNDGVYNAQDNTHYATFEDWLETFISLN